MRYRTAGQRFTCFLASAISNIPDEGILYESITDCVFPTVSEMPDVKAFHLSIILEILVLSLTRSVAPLSRGLIVSVKLFTSPQSPDCALNRATGSPVSSRYTFPLGLGSALSLNRILYSFILKFKKGMNFLPEIKVDKEFQSLIPPLSQEEYAQLESNIISDGCRDALVIWSGILIDGHNRYKICTEHNIPFQTIDKQLDSRNDAIQWIILNQFGRRNLSPGNRSLLALKLEPIYKAKAKARQESGINQYSLPQKSAEPSIETRSEVAKLAGVSHDTIDKVKKIVDHGTPEQVERIKKGDKGNTVNAVYQEIKAKEIPKPIPASVLGL